MKKILFSVALFAAALGASAIDEVGLETTTFQAGKTAVVKVILNTTTYNDEMKNLMFDMYFPTGWAVSTGASSMTTNTDRTVGEVWDTDFEDWVESGDFTPKVTKQTVAGYSVYRTSLLSSDNHPLSGNTGWIYTITVKAPNDAVPGYYPVKIVKAYMNKDAVDAHNVNFPDAVCYMKVGEPENANLALEGVVPSFVNDALAQETALTSLDLEKVTAFNGDFVYVAGRDVVAPATAVEANVKYVAPAPAKYATLCLPSEAAVNCWKYSRKEGDVAIFEESTVAPAGEAVIIENAVETAAAKATIASVAKKTINSGAYLVGEKLHTVNGNAVIPALRGYWEGTFGSNCRIAFDTATGIQMIGTAADIDNTYDLQGRQVQNAKNGVFVVNGKKQFVK